MLKKMLAGFCAVVSKQSAKRSANTASTNGFNQPKEPETIAKLRKK